MKCRKCGAVLLDTDTFCVKCGQRVDQPMFCSSCGEQLRDGERFCHKCGSPVESAAEDEEIPLSKQRTVDIPFDQIEQGILMEAEQAIVKRPDAERPERRSTEGYSRPGANYGQGQREPGSYSRPAADMPAGYRQPEAEEGSVRRAEAGYAQEPDYRARPQRNADYYGDDEDDGSYRASARTGRSVPPRSRYEEEYDEDEYDDDDEDSGDSKMRIVTIIMGIIVVAVMLAVGFILWQRNNPSRYDRPEEGTEQGEESEGEDGNGENGEQSSAETKGRIQILSNVNVRNAPTTEGSEVLMVAKKGETYEYYELVDDSWYHIKLEDGREGYVSEKYVEDLE